MITLLYIYIYIEYIQGVRFNNSEKLFNDSETKNMKKLSTFNTPYFDTKIKLNTFLSISLLMNNYYSRLKLILI